MPILLFYPLAPL